MVICTTKKKRLFLIITIIAVIILAGAFQLYLKRITICEDLSIHFQGVSANDSKLIKINSISPTGKEKPLLYLSQDSSWNTEKHSYHHSIQLLIPDTLIGKITNIIVFADGKQKMIFPKDLNCVRKNNNGNCRGFYLLENIKTDKSYFKKLKFVFATNSHAIFTIFKYIAFILIIVFFIGLFFVLGKKVRIKRKPSKVYSISSNKIIKWAKIIAVSVIIALSFFYGFIFIKLFVTTFITSLVFIMVSCTILWIIGKIAITVFKVSDKFSKKLTIGITIFFFIWSATETTLWLFNINKSYNEKLTGYYSSGFIDNNKRDEKNPHLMVHDKNKSLYYPSGNEFHYETNTNGEGLRDIDHPLKKDTNEYRIICLGNSYTEGVGAPQDSTWPKLLENKLQLVTDKKIRVFNAGVSGSDPFFQFMLLDKRMLKYQPDLVLVALGSTDFNFYRFRGGFERFTKDGCQYRKGPWWEKIYAVSYVYRFYLNNIRHYKIKFLQSPEEYKEDSIRANHAIENCVQQFYQLSRQKDFLLAIVFIDEWGYDRYDFLKNKLRSEGTIPVIDLVNYNTQVEKLTEEDYFNYYWPIDKHCNPKGYELYAKGIFWHFEKMGILDSIQTK